MKYIILLIFISFSFGQISTTNFGITKEGGLKVLLTNRTGTATVYGTLVSASRTHGMAFTNCFDGYGAIGSVYTVVSNGLPCWIVIAGFADVLLGSNIQVNAGNFLQSDTNGIVDSKEF